MDRRQFVRRLVGVGLGLSLWHTRSVWANVAQAGVGQDVLLDAVLAPGGRCLLLFAGQGSDYVRACDSGSSLATARTISLPAEFAALGIRSSGRRGQAVVFGARVSEVAEEYPYDLTFELPPELQPLTQLLPTSGRHLARSWVAYPATGTLADSSFSLDPNTDARSGYVVDVSPAGVTATLMATEIGADPSRLHRAQSRPLAVVDHLSNFHQAVLVGQRVIWIRRDLDGSAVVCEDQTETYRFPARDNSRLRLSTDAVGRTRLVELGESGQWISSAISVAGRGWRRVQPPAIAVQDPSAARALAVPISNDPDRFLSVDADAVVRASEAI